MCECAAAQGGGGPKLGGAAGASAHARCTHSFSTTPNKTCRMTMNISSALALPMAAMAEGPGWLSATSMAPRMLRCVLCRVKAVEMTVAATTASH